MDPFTEVTEGLEFMYRNRLGRVTCIKEGSACVGYEQGPFALKWMTLNDLEAAFASRIARPLVDLIPRISRAA